MDTELQAIREAMDKDAGEGRDYDHAVELSDTFAAAHPDLFAFLADMSIESCVALVDTFREAGDEESLWRVQAWILHRWPPQHIGGQAQVEIRIVPEGGAE